MYYREKLNIKFSLQFSDYQVSDGRKKNSDF